MISVESARRIIASHVGKPHTVEVDFHRALGRVLACDVTSDGFYPSADLSTMDGYVIGADEMPGTFRVTGEIPAGASPDVVLRKGEAFRIFTGAPIPEGGGRVLMQEDVTRDGDQITTGAFAENRFIRPQGSEATPGKIVVPAGTKLGAAELAILAQVGAIRPQVFRSPVIRHLATGSELVAPGEIPSRGQIRETNSTLLHVLLEPFHPTLFDSRRVTDEADAIVEAASGECDLLLISGGAGGGDYDFGAEALRRLGFTIHFDKVNLRPGKPLTFATRGTQLAFVIPGNPVSHFVCFHVAIRLAVERLCGLPPSWNFLPLQLAADGPIVTPGPREAYWPATVSIRDGRLIVTPKRWSTSGDTFSLVGTNALARVNQTSPHQGRLETLLLDLPHHEPI